MANQVPPFYTMLCIGLLVLSLEGGAIRRQAQLQNVQQPNNFQNPGDQQMQQGLQNGFNQGDQGQNTVNSFQSNGFAQQPAATFGGSGGVEALVNILQQLLMQQHQMPNGAAPDQARMAGGQQFGQPSAPLLALLGNAAMTAGSNAVPPASVNVGDAGGQSLPAPVPNLGGQQLDQSTGNGSSGMPTPLAGNPAPPFMPSGKDAESSNASSQFMGLLGK